MLPRGSHLVAAAAAFLLAGGGCRHAAPGSSPVGFGAPVDVAALREHVARCPVVLTDAALDDLATYQTCTIPPAIADRLRNDYLDEEQRLPDYRLPGGAASGVTRSVFEAQLARFVDPAGALRGVVSIDAAHERLRPDPVLAPGAAIPFATGPEPPQQCREECEGRLVTPPRAARPYREDRRAELLRGADPRRPLRGVRVGLDPGHAGGRFGPMEGRDVALLDGDRAQVVREGDLTLRTAHELRGRLAALGAEVTLTRETASLVHPEPLHAYRPAAERLLRRIALDPVLLDVQGALGADDRRRLRAAIAVHAVARQSRYESLRARAERLAAANPDLVLSIHFNANPPGVPGTAPQDLVAMVRGNHAPERLYQPWYRWRALQEAFAVADFDAAVHLGARCVRAMSRSLGLPVARRNHYPDHLPVRDAAGDPVGVDAWDGALLRQLDGVAVLTEGPWVDRPEETRRLARDLATPVGTAATRTDQYAAALESCVVEWVGRWLASRENPFAGDP